MFFVTLAKYHISENLLPNISTNLYDKEMLVMIILRLVKIFDTYGLLSWQQVRCNFHFRLSFLLHLCLYFLFFFLYAFASL